MTTREILIAARALIADPARWCRGAFGQDDEDCILSIEELLGRGACKWCALGAVYHVAGYRIEVGVAELNLASRYLFNKKDATLVNDELGHDAVLRVYDFVIRGMEESE